MKRLKIATALGLPLTIIALIIPTTVTLADPILKPRKYHGPIPQKAFTLHIGFFAGADNEDLWTHFDNLIEGPFKKELVTDDFGPAFAIDGSFMNKLHPQFAIRLRGGVSFLSSESTGLTTAPADTGDAPLVRFKRSFDVSLMSVVADGMYFFQDASVSEFQAYIGLGLGFIFPYQRFEEQLVDEETGAELGPDPKTKISAEPEAHALIGTLYHVKTTVALHLEGRFQISQSKIDLEVPTVQAGLQTINFDVDYTGFVLAAGISWFF